MNYDPLAAYAVADLCNFSESTEIPVKVLVLRLLELAKIESYLLEKRYFVENKLDFTEFILVLLVNLPSVKTFAWDITFKTTVACACTFFSLAGIPANFLIESVLSVGGIPAVFADKLEQHEHRGFSFALFRVAHANTLLLFHAFHPVSGNPS
jgi:hypothetical protein